MPTTPIDTLSCRQVAEILHTTESGLAQMRYRGSGPKFCRVAGRKIIYRVVDVESYLETNLMRRTDDPRGAA
jgi:hypothetical protein